MNGIFRNRAGLAVLCLLVLAPRPVDAAAGDGPADSRARIVESTLKDLSIGNDTALGSGRIAPKSSQDALGAPRLDLEPEPALGPSAALRGEVQSSLHKLRRETASERTPDEREARVNESLDRAAETAADPKP